MKQYQADRKALAELGMSDDEIDIALEARKPEQATAFEIWEENVPMLELFCALETQWRVAAGFTIAFIGIDYPAAEALMRARRVKNRAEAFGDLRAMERAALAVLNAPKDDIGDG